jgi:hypothetical protein
MDKWRTPQPWYTEAEGWDGKDRGVQPCLHKGCSDCHGTGTKKNGELCVHFISCPCPQCTIMT